MANLTIFDLTILKKKATKFKLKFQIYSLILNRVKLNDRCKEANKSQ